MGGLNRLKEKERENMKHWIRRTFTLSALIATMAVSFAASAQPLPLPQPPAAGLTSVIEVILPESGAEATYYSSFVWGSELPQDSYVLRFKFADGTTAKYSVPMEACAPDGTCAVELADTGVLNTVSDNDVITWRVIAKHGDEKTKSAKATFIANTVSTPELINAVGGVQLSADEELSWTANAANERYILIIREAETGALALKRNIAAEFCELGVCVYDPIPGLAQQTDYIWFVKAKGYTGDKAKSAKQTFTTGSWAVAMK